MGKGSEQLDTIWKGESSGSVDGFIESKINLRHDGIPTIEIVCRQAPKQTPHKKLMTSVWSSDLTVHLRIECSKELEGNV